MKLSKMAGSATAALVLSAGLAGAAGAAPAQALNDSPHLTLTSSMTVDAPIGGEAGVTYSLTVSNPNHTEGKSFFSVQCSSALDSPTIVSKPSNWDALDCASPRMQVNDLYLIPAGQSQKIVMHFQVTDVTAPVSISVNSDYLNTPGTTANSDSSPLTIVSAAPTVGHLGAPYSFNVSDSRFTPSVFSATGLEAAGLTIDPTTGRIQGTPTTAGVFPVTVSAHSSTGGADATATYSLKITGDAPSFTTTTLASAVAGEAYSAAIEADGHPQFAVTTGALPAGLKLNKTTGVVSGTPTAAGSFHLEVTAANTSGSTKQQFTIEVAGAGGGDM